MTTWTIDMYRIANAPSAIRKHTLSDHARRHMRELAERRQGSTLLKRNLKGVRQIHRIRPLKKEATCRCAATLTRVCSLKSTKRLISKRAASARLSAAACDVHYTSHDCHHSTLGFGASVVNFTNFSSSSAAPEASRRGQGTAGGWLPAAPERAA